MNKTLIISITTIICVVLIGGIYYSVETNKQNAIEKQQRLEDSKLEDCLSIAKQKREKNKDSALDYTNTKCMEEFTQNACIKEFIKALEEYEAEEKQDIDACYNRHSK